MLTIERLKEVLDYNPVDGKFRWKTTSPWSKRKVGDVAGWPVTHGYLQLRIDGRLYLCHRLAWFYVHGKWPEPETDHFNGVKDDNRITNLREVSKHQNLANKDERSTSKSGARGVVWKSRSKSWEATITIRGEKRVLGRFDTIEGAIRARRFAVHRVMSDRISA